MIMMRVSIQVGGSLDGRAKRGGARGSVGNIDVSYQSSITRMNSRDCRSWKALIKRMMKR